MVELVKNVGLGIFVNGAYAWQFAGAGAEGLLAVIEGVSIMAFMIYIEKKGAKK